MGKLNRLIRGKKKVYLPAMGRVTPFEVVCENMVSWGHVTRFLDRDVGDSEIRKLVAAAITAHSSGDREPWEFMIVRNADLKRRLGEATEKQDWMADAPVLMVLCANNKIAGAGLNGERGIKLYAVQDVAAAAENVLLAATSIGLASSWVGEFNEPKVCLVLHTPEWIRPQVIIAVGWPAEAPVRKQRHHPDDIIHFDTYGQTPRALDAWGHGH